MIRITVASSSWSPGASLDSRMASRASSSASNTRNASSRLRRSPGGTGSSSGRLTGESLVEGCDDHAGRQPEARRTRAPIAKLRSQVSMPIRHSASDLCLPRRLGRGRAVDGGDREAAAALQGPRQARGQWGAGQREVGERRCVLRSRSVLATRAENAELVAFRVGEYDP